MNRPKNLSLLKFREDLPEPLCTQSYLYVDGGNNADMAALIEEHFEELQECSDHSFLYFPHLLARLTSSDLFAYYYPGQPVCLPNQPLDFDHLYAPYLLTPLEAERKPGLLCKCFDDSEIKAFRRKDKTPAFYFYYLPLETPTLSALTAALATMIEWKRECEGVFPMYSASDTIFYDDTTPDEQYADNNFDESTAELISDVRKKIEKLRLSGVDEYVLRQLLKPSLKISKLRLTKDFRIILPDYNDMEITMPLLHKALYILFLKHPEGIIFKDLPDYRDELRRIYYRITCRIDEEKMEDSILKLTAPTCNSINEKCSRIRGYFLEHFSEDIVRHYCIMGKSRTPKRVLLSRNLISWECEL